MSRNREKADQDEAQRTGSGGMLVLFRTLRQPPFAREKAVDGQSPRAAQDQREQTCNRACGVKGVWAG